MKPSRYKTPEIEKLVKRYRSGSTVAEICADCRISPSTFYAWRIKFGHSTSMELETVVRLQKENRRLRRQLAEVTEETDRLKGLVRRFSAKVPSKSSQQFDRNSTATKAAGQWYPVVHQDDSMIPFLNEGSAETHVVSLQDSVGSK